jgi:hypothetical protein
MNDMIPDSKNYFLLYAEAVFANRIEGKLLRFSKGDFIYGSDDAVLPTGTKLVALMNTFSVGWQHWVAGKPADGRFGLLVDGYKPPQRNELGDDDSSSWETDANGDKRDPWVFTNRIVLVQQDDDATFTFVTSSKGGIEALGDLSKTHGKAIKKTHPGTYPVVSLEVGGYIHSNKSIGRVKQPVFRVIEHIDAAPFGGAPAEDAAPAARISSRLLPDDDIPF